MHCFLTKQPRLHGVFVPSVNLAAVGSAWGDTGLSWSIFEIKTLFYSANVTISYHPRVARGLVGLKRSAI